NFTTESFNRDKDQLRQAGMMLNGLVPPGPGAQAITGFFEDFANTYQAKTDGAMMWISATFRNETVRDMMLFVEQEVQKQGGGLWQPQPFPPPGGQFPPGPPPFPPPGPPKGFPPGPPGPRIAPPGPLGPGAMLRDVVTNHL